MRSTLTDTKVRQAKARFSTLLKVSDGGGLFLYVTPNGGKLWRWSYRYGGKPKLMALGKYPDVSLTLARERHRAGRGLLATGLDPMAQKKADKLRAHEERMRTPSRPSRPNGWSTGEKESLFVMRTL